MNLAGWDMLPEWNSPLTPGVQLVNMSHSEDWLALQIDLSHDWPRMLRHLTAVGSGLVMTRNEVAILGRRMRYPDFEWTAGRSKGADAQGGVWMNYRALGGARAMHTRRETGHVFGAEFRDSDGKIVHRYTLTPDSDLNEFCGWVRLHQACAAHVPEMGGVFEESDFAASGHAGTSYGGGSELIENLLGLCLENGVTVQVVVGTPAVTQRATFIPESLRPTDGWWFASSDDVGLHFRGDLFTQIVTEQSEMAEWPSVRCVTADQACALRIELGDPAQAVVWRQLMEAIF